MKKYDNILRMGGQATSSYGAWKKWKNGVNRAKRCGKGMFKKIPIVGWSVGVGSFVYSAATDGLSSAAAELGNDFVWPISELWME